MYKADDFLNMAVSDISGKRIGFIKDLMVDFNLNKIIGFLIAPNSLFAKNAFVFNEDIIYFNEYMIIKEYSETKGIRFSVIRNMEIIDKIENIIGVLEDIIFDRTFNVRAIVVSLGIARKIFKGKRILLPHNIVVGDKSILCVNNSKIKFMSIIHNFHGKGDYEEKY